MTKARKATAVARLREHPDLAYWREVAGKVAASAFCRGHNDRGWKAGPDFFLKPGTSVKALEGVYDGTAPPGTRVTQADKDWSDVPLSEPPTELFHDA